MPRPTQFARAVILGLAISLAPALLAQTKPSPAQKPASPPNPTTLGAGRGTSKMGGGIIFGNHWLILFDGVPPDWIADTELANQLGLQEIFHPQDWNPHRLAPSLMVAFSEKEKDEVTVASEMARDAKSMKQQFPHNKMISATAVVITAKRKAPVQIFTYKHGWDMVAYSDGGQVIFLTTLHCEKAAQCAPLEPAFRKLVRNLHYQGGVKVVDQTTH